MFTLRNTLLRAVFGSPSISGLTYLLTYFLWIALLASVRSPDCGGLHQKRRGTCCQLPLTSARSDFIVPRSGTNLFQVNRKLKSSLLRTALPINHLTAVMNTIITISDF